MTTIVTASSTTSGDNRTLAYNEDLYVPPDVVIASSGGKGIVGTATAHAINISGTVFGDSVGVEIGDAGGTSGFSSLTIAAGGSVIAHLDAVYSQDDDVHIMNSGQISGADGVNHAVGSRYELFNSGTITGAYGNGVRVDSSSGTIVNHGIIQGLGGAGVQVYNSATSNAAPTLINYGYVGGGSRAFGGDPVDANSVTNFGQMDGGISTGSGADAVRNGGLIQGDVTLFDGGDSFDGRGGTVAGTVYGGNGVDTLRGGDGEDRLSGEAGDDILIGGVGDDTLNGGANADVMRGWLGDDSYVVDSAFDQVIEAMDQGVDSVESTVSFVLAANVEHLTLGGVGTINGTGNTLANEIVGNSAANTLSGGAGNDALTGNGGNDKLVGGLGNDVLTGGLGSDLFRFDTLPNATANKDTIADFNVPADTIQLENAVLAAVGLPGTLAAAAFWKSATATAAHDASDRIIYNTTTGALYYDPDGTGAAAKVQIATLAGSPDGVTNLDFSVT